MLATQQQWPPSYLDEVSRLLVAVPYPHTKPSRPQDAEYGLLTALAELEAWLEAGPNDRQPSGDRHSFAADVANALSGLGPAVSSRIPAAAVLVAALQAVASDGPRADREPVIKNLAAVRAGLSDPKTSVAALEDLLDAVRDPLSSHLLVANRLAVLTEVLEISDRASAEICRILGGILDDQALEISIARHSLDGTPRAKVDKPDDFAGLAEEGRLELSRRFLLRPAQEGHHVVWVAYDDARVDADGSWRQRVGMVEFFDGPTLVEALTDAGPAVADAPLPEELLTAIGPGGRDVDLWPSLDRHRHWVAARVDLGTDTFSNPIEVARAQADAVVELAAFESGKSIWSPLAGVLHLVDDVHHSSEQFHTPDEIQRRISVDNDSTAAEFPEIASSIAGHLPIVDPALRRLLREIGALNATTRSGGLDLLTREVTVIETVTRMNGQSPTGWADFLENHMPIFQARHRVTREIYDAVSEVLNALYFKDAPHLNIRAILEPLPDGRALFKWKVAFDLVPQLVAEVPEHHMPSRRLREVARRTQDVTHLRDWVDELAADSRTKIRRAARLRNGLSHAGAAPAGVTSTVRLLVNRYARLVAGAALEAVVAGRPVKQAFDGHRTGNKRWRQRIPAAADVSAALFDPPEEDMRSNDLVG
jgi:hypothetical protein